MVAAFEAASLDVDLEPSKFDALVRIHVPDAFLWGNAAVSDDFGYPAEAGIEAVFAAWVGSRCVLVAEPRAVPADSPAYWGRGID